MPMKRIRDDNSPNAFKQFTIEYKARVKEIKRNCYDNFSNLIIYDSSELNVPFSIVRVWLIVITVC